MSGEWLFGQQACGCITRVDCEPDDMQVKDRNEWGRFVADGGSAFRLPEPEARERMTDLAFECPHDPIGWGLAKGQPSPYRQTSLIEGGRNDG
jgi:hypothetical protein